MSSGGYDGSIRIDTSIDDKSFNAGISKLASSIKSAMGSVLGVISKVVGEVALSAMLIGALMATITAAIVAAVGAIISFGVQLINAMSQAISRTTEYGKQIANLEKSFADIKGAVYAAFSPLITAAVPYIMLVVNWLVKMLNTIAMIIAALTGQKTVMQYIAGSADTAATSTGRLAGNTEKATKAAKGALAAFDQLNVLQKDTADASGGGVGANGGAMQFTEVPVDTTIQEKVNSIKQWFADAWKWISQAASDAWNFIQEIWGKVAEWFNVNVITPLRQPFNDLVKVAIECFQQLNEGFIKPLINFLVTNLWPVVQSIFSLMGKFIGNTFAVIGAIVKEFVSLFVGALTTFMKVLSGVIEFITGIFTGNWKLAWKGIVDIFTGLFTGMVTLVKAVVNTIIDLINGALRGFSIGINAIIGGLNSIHITIPDWVTKLTGIGGTWGMNLPTMTAPQIPRLATGAVIPPNSEFAAILGDQRSGRNIEAPEDLLRQLYREEHQGQPAQEITIRFEGNLSSLVRELKPYVDKENARIGSSLISSGSSL